LSEWPGILTTAHGSGGKKNIVQDSGGWPIRPLICPCTAFFSVTRERVRQIKTKAVKALQHPVRARQLSGFLDETRHPAPLTEVSSDTAVASLVGA